MNFTGFCKLLDKGIHEGTCVKNISELYGGKKEVKDFYTFIPKETYLNQSICSEYDIFRCSKSVAAIYVSDKIKKIVDSNNWVGFTFYEQN